MSDGDWIAIIGLIISFACIVVPFLIKNSNVMTEVRDDIRYNRQMNEIRDKRLDDLEQHDAEQDIVIAQHGEQIAQLRNEHQRVHQFDGVNRR